MSLLENGDLEARMHAYVRREEGPLMTEAKTGMMEQQDKKCWLGQEPPEARESQRIVLSQSIYREHNPINILILDLAFRTVIT